MGLVAFLVLAVIVTSNAEASTSWGADPTDAYAEMDQIFDDHAELSREAVQFEDQGHGRLDEKSRILVTLLETIIPNSDHPFILRYLAEGLKAHQHSKNELLVGRGQSQKFQSRYNCEDTTECFGPQLGFYMEDFSQAGFVRRTELLIQEGQLRDGEETARRLQRDYSQVGLSLF